MKKTSFQFSGAGFSKVLGAFMLLAVALLFSHEVNGQSGFVADPVTQAANSIKPSNGQPISFSNLVDPASAIQTLADEHDRLGQVNPGSLQEEALNGVLIAYYEAILMNLRDAQLPLDEAIVAGMPAIDEVNQRLNANIRQNRADVLQIAVDLLKL